MSEEGNDALVALIDAVKTAIQRADGMPGPRIITVSQVDLQIKVLIQKVVGVDASISWLPIPLKLDASAHHTDAQVQTIALSFVPAPISKGLTAMASVADELADAIAAIKAGVAAAAQSEPRFALQQASASLDIGETDDGKLVIIVGGSQQSQNTHTVTLTFQPAGDNA